MPLFLMWIGITAVFLTGISVVIWKINPGEHFRAKLTITFLLFVAVPNVPLTYMTASLLTGSARMLLPDTIGEALTRSLDCLRIQIAEKGEAFAQTHYERMRFSRQDLLAGNIQTLTLCKIEKDTVISQQHIALSSAYQEPPISQTEIRQRFAYGNSSHLFEQNRHDWFCYFQARPDSTMLVIKYPVDTKLAESRRQIETALIMVNTLSVIRESVLKKNIIWALALVLIAGLLVLTWIVSKKLSGEMTHPIRALVHGMEKVASGDLAYQVRTEAKDEFRFMIDRFNAMTVDLRETHERLLQAERLAAWQAVARQISHEIKNSITPVTISLHRIKKDLGSSIPSKVLESMRTIEEEMTMLQNMAAEFSEFARMPEPKRSRIDLNDTVRSASQLMENTHPGIRFHVNLDTDLLEVYADLNQLKRVLNNLLKNAAEAIEDEGDIWINTVCLSRKKTVRLEVRDTGKGMDATAISRIFQPYFTTKKRGTGLGMAMVYKIIEAHQGSIQISSTPGEGTNITILLPAAAPT